MKKVKDPLYDHFKAVQDEIKNMVGNKVWYVDGTGFVAKYMHKYEPSELKLKVSTISKTKLKSMLYSLINMRDRLEKKNVVYTADVGPDKSINWGMHQSDKDTPDIAKVKEAILIVTDEIAHRAFAKLCPDTDTNKTGDNNKE